VSLITRYHRRNPLALARLWIEDLYFAVYGRLFRPIFPLPQKLNRILLVNPAHLGDIVISTALIREIKDRFPACKVDVLTGDWGMPLLHEHPGIGNAYYLNHWKANRSQESIRVKKDIYRRQLEKVIPQLKQNAYDAIFFLNAYEPSLIGLFKKFKCPLIGFDTAGGGPLLTKAFQNTNIHLHEIQYQGSLFAHWLGEPKSTIEYRSWLKSPHTPIEPIGEFDPAKPYVVIHPGSGNPAKEWAIENWQKVIQAMEHYDVQIVLTGQGLRELKQAEGLLKSIPEVKIFNFVNQLDFDRYCALIANSNAVLCVDSLAGHITSAFERQVVVVTNGLSLISRWHPLGKKVNLLKNLVNCSPCHANPCSQRMCINEITPQALIQLLPQLLSQKMVLG
jgi:ADP-heptose:LPS heptosyltransferase